MVMKIKFFKCTINECNHLAQNNHNDDHNNNNHDYYNDHDHYNDNNYYYNYYNNAPIYWRDYL